MAVRACGFSYFELDDLTRLMNAIAGRYISGMTPGYRIGRGLGGNVNGLSRAEVNRWRNRYVAERARIGVSGFGEFHFVSENSRTFVMQDAARAVARGMASL